MAEVALQVPQGVQRKATLLDLLDRVLGKGAVAYGDIILSIADLDLVYLNLRAVLSAIGTLEQAASGRSGGLRQIPSFSGAAPEPWEEAGTCELLEEIGSVKVDGEGAGEGQGSDLPVQPALAGQADIAPEPSPSVSHPHSAGLPAVPPPEPTSAAQAGKLELDPQKTAQGLAKLVLTLINLLRKLMERQAIRRMEAGTLTPEQLERAGQAFKRLNDEMENLRKQFGLKEEELNLDLGPLGKLM